MGEHTNLMTSGLGVLLLIILCYLAGRLHQWYRATSEREDAYRDGYNTATRALFSLATRTHRVVTAARPSAATTAATFDRGVSPLVVRGEAKVTPLEAQRARHRADPDTGDIPLAGRRPPRSLRASA